MSPNETPKYERRWELRHGVVDCSATPVVMGVLNVTPDSFSDGGLYAEAASALRQVDKMVAEGAGIVDVGPESTRPGSDPVPESVQVERIGRVLERLRRNHPDLPISIDTRLASVAAAAIELGADIINDVSALRYDPEMVKVARETRTPVILMHMRGEPKTMQVGGPSLQRWGTRMSHGFASPTAKAMAPPAPFYKDVVQDVVEFLKERVSFAERNGVPRERVAIDVGIGFGKTGEHNLRLIQKLDAFVALGLPVVLGVSRKRFIGEILGRPNPGDRVAGSVACAAAAVLAGVQIIRAHDVRETVDAVRVAQAIRDAS